MMERLSDDVTRELARFGPASGMPRIVEAWTTAVGRTIARNAWPARIARDGTLHVATSSASWAFELQQLERDIVRRLRGAVGTAAPASIRFTVGKLPEHGRDEESERAVQPRPQPGPEEYAKAAELTAEIADEELRKLVAKAAAQSLADAGSNRVF